MEVQELNDEGRYAAVNIEAEPEVGLKYMFISSTLFPGRCRWCGSTTTGPGEKTCGEVETSS